MIRIERYEPSLHTIWNEFVASSKNGTFLFNRGYMDYHSDRFTDHSLMFYRDQRLISVFPANRSGDLLVSHGGLTFGGLVTDQKMSIALMMDIFAELHKYSLAQGIARVIYKAIPYIYHRLPAGEDLYPLFFHKARLYRRDVSSTIDMSNALPFAKGRRGCIKKALTGGVIVRQCDEYEKFMQIDEHHLLQKHNKKPVHTAQELRLLSSRFPQNIQLYGAYLNEVMLGGVIVYSTDTVAHAQYIAATSQGKALCALDAILNHLIAERFRDKRYFDFGISTDREAQVLDLNLVSNKESFGARATVYDFYEWNLKN